MTSLHLCFAMFSCSLCVARVYPLMMFSYLYKQQSKRWICHNISRLISSLPDAYSILRNTSDTVICSLTCAVTSYMYFLPFMACSLPLGLWHHEINMGLHTDSKSHLLESLMWHLCSFGCLLGRLHLVEMTFSVGLSWTWGREYGLSACCTRRSPRLRLHEANEAQSALWLIHAGCNQKTSDRISMWIKQHTLFRLS